MKKVFLISIICFFIYGCTDNTVATFSTTQANTTTPLDTSQAVTLISQKCAYCHSLTPNPASGYRTAPEGIILDTQAQMVNLASEIKMETVNRRIMPERPVTITEEERTLIGAWADQQ